MMNSTYVNVIMLFVILLLLVYRYVTQRFQYWAKKGIPYLKPNLIFGNSREIIFQHTSMLDHFSAIYRELAPHPIAGYFNFQKPLLLVRDPELTKSILTKDFSYFTDRLVNFSTDNDVLTHHLFNLCGEKWKNLRAKLTPTFTSGKMKQMFHLMKDCSDELNGIIEEQLDRKVEHLDMKELFAQYATDVIGSCAFGVQANSLRSKDADAEFRSVSKKIFERNVKMILKGFVINWSPKLFKLLRLRLTDYNIERFFVKFIKDAVKYRTDNEVVRNDFLNILMELKEKDDQKFDGYEACQNTDIRMTIELMAAQCFVFFLAGSHTSSNVLTHCLLELSKHPEYQEKLYKEIENALEHTNGEITYDVLLKIPFMEQVICETMRLYPTLPVLFRHCVKSYQIPDTNVIIDKGTDVFILACGMQKDEQYFPSPEVFNPENFSEENKSSRHPFVFLPFGEGPRICIAARFGQMQVRLALITLIRNYQFSLSPKMKFPFKFNSSSVLTTIDGEVWLQCKRR